MTGLACFQDFGVTLGQALDKTEGNKVPLILQDGTQLDIKVSGRFPITSYSRFILKAIMLDELAGTSVCDFGCGCGVLSLVCAYRGALAVHAIDVDSEAIGLCGENAKYLRLDQIHCIHRRTEETPGQSAENETEYDWIYSNPASLPAPQSDDTRFYSGGSFGVSMSEDLIRFAKDRLKPSGCLTFLITSLSDFSHILDVLDENNLSVEIEQVLQLKFREHYYGLMTDIQTLRDHHLNFFFKNDGDLFELVYLVRARRIRTKSRQRS